MVEFYIPKADVIFEEEIKKSRFITYIRHTEGIEEAKAFLAELRKKYPDARHHCWAAVAGSPNDSQQYGFTDDGEPQGTAGKPMLNHLLGSGMGEISVVVVRYFGGIKLGTGGLVRAYGNGVQQALKQVEKIRKVLRKSYRLYCEYDQFNSLQNLLSTIDIEIYDQQFSDKVMIELGINPTEFDDIQQAITERFSGQLNLIEIE
ncbi:YigZ family protein [Phocoenobacter skyensis]|uniref:Uncharacterized protein, YigZ family n=1 Tax=Phocoenobacter skyensis TaxID=97481 RepID=A0A1H7WQ16_9PAST|nr:YigZ family protein [Pasteurella skyensis]MDP8078981.1 YigZ family protein [Pasteurella skyensis]MDP8084931.1 YigZ family protein [Pasteurella skyensis]MDP8169938.1 YigZ family protein [Pasteurella skyensis]MDP8174126.1 YigZ family protein [Pasteurella skyensis]MDP8185233.1 YigZ family protein [Pasteurella skyensis]